MCSSTTTSRGRWFALSSAWAGSTASARRATSSSTTWSPPTRARATPCCTLLNNFVNAANELRGQMFDSLSAVAEITGVDYDKWLTDLYGNDEDRKAAAIRRRTAGAVP